MDATLSCVRDVYHKPAVWDSTLGFWTDPAVLQCPSSETALAEFFATRGIRAFDAGDFVFVIASKLFQPAKGGTERPHSFLRWNTIKIHLNLQSLREGDALPQEAPRIAKQILREARMVPFNMSAANNEGLPVPGAVDTSLNIALWEGQLGPRSDKSFVAVVSGEPPFSTGRLVYGELRGAEYLILWDSPLFNVLHGNIYFLDVNGDGDKEIVIESTTYGNQEYPILVIFDKNGREITRQKKCDTESGTGDNFNHEDGTCAIFGDDITFSENEEGPKEIYVRNWEGGKNHIFKLNKDGFYIPGPPVAGSFPPPPPLPPPSPDPVQLNQQGIKFMQRKDYTSAIIAFERADLLAAHKNPEYANNVGFAMYRAGRYEASVDWLNTTISLDPKRAVAYLNLGDACAKLNRNAEARDAYNRYLELAPDSKAAPDVKKKLDALPPSP